MPDLLTHVLVTYVLARPLADYSGSLTDRAVPTAMAGALVPDAVKVNILLAHYEVEALLGIPFRWFPLASLGGSLLSAGMVSVLVSAEYRRRVFGVLSAGAGLHIFLDALISKPAPTTPPKLYPLTFWQPPTVGLYLSSDIWPWMVAVVLAVVVFVGSRVGLWTVQNTS